jgi:hypothetical protein
MFRNVDFTASPGLVLGPFRSLGLAVIDLMPVPLDE